jgi:hypothetical protein
MGNRNFKPQQSIDLGDNMKDFTNTPGVTIRKNFHSVPSIARITWSLNARDSCRQNNLTNDIYDITIVQ